VPGLGAGWILHRKAIRLGYSSSSPSDTKGLSGLLFALLEHKNQVSVKIARAKQKKQNRKQLKYEINKLSHLLARLHWKNMRYK